MVVIVVRPAGPTNELKETRMSTVGSPRRGAMLALVFASAVFFPTSAVAAKGLGPGVHVDPNSPAAKEYQIPLGAARGNGQSGSSSRGSLFGKGITPASTTSSDTSTTSPVPATTTPSPPAQTATVHHRHHRTSHKRHRTSHRRQAVAAAGSPSGGAGSGPRSASPPSPAREIGTGSGGGTGITWMLGAAVAVLLLGGLGGGLLARRDRRARQPKQASQTTPYVS